MQSALVEEALEEFLEASRFLEIQSKGLGERFNLALVETIELLKMFPEMGRELARYGVRKQNMRTFSYFLIYRVEGELLVIYAIAHHKQRPEYWVNRLGE